MLREVFSGSTVEHDGWRQGGGGVGLLSPLGAPVGAALMGGGKATDSREGGRAQGSLWTRWRLIRVAEGQEG